MLIIIIAIITIIIIISFYIIIREALQSTHPLSSSEQFSEETCNTSLVCFESHIKASKKEK